MTAKKQLDALWHQLNESLERADKEFAGNGGDITALIHEFSERGRGRINELMAREIAHERGHRRFRPASVDVSKLSVADAARLLLMHNIAKGSHLTEMPAATAFVLWRDTAAESYLLGFALRAYLSGEWCAAAMALDYAHAIETNGRELSKAPKYQPKTGQACSCKPGVQRDNCPRCEGTGMCIDFAAIRARKGGC